MRRVAALAAVLAAAGALFVLVSGSGKPAEPEFHLELDNAFGLITGGDLKIAGVRAGKITSLDLDRRTKRAIVGFSIDQTGFGDLRSDVHCDVFPQSLVGEYFVDCQPGRAAQRWDPRRTIPVSHSATVVPPDLVGNIQRLPYRERLRLIITELGAAVGGNGQNLNDALRRANPALRETNRVLAILARQNQVLADLVENGDRVLADLGDNRKDVARFVVEARDTAVASASRDRDIAAGFKRLPPLLRELRPTMAELGRTADVQGPALAKLAASAGELDTFLQRLQPFAEASRPALRSLGETAVVGRATVPKARPTVAQLERYASGVPELARNAAIVLGHLDNRDFAVEDDPDSPGGKGFTGLEAILQYVYDQTLAINVFDRERHLLKAIPFVGKCQRYADIKAAKDLADECAGILGPNGRPQAVPDHTAPKGYDGADRRGAGDAESGPSGTPLDDVLSQLPPLPRADRGGRGDRGAGSGRGGGSAGSGSSSPAPAPGAGPDAIASPDLHDVLPGIPAPSTPAVPPPPAPAAPSVQHERAVSGLADYLFGP